MTERMTERVRYSTGRCCDGRCCDGAAGSVNADVTNMIYDTSSERHHQRHQDEKNKILQSTNPQIDN